MNDGVYLRHTVVGFVFKNSELYQDRAEVVDTKKLNCKVKFINRKIEIIFKEEDEKDFMGCSAFQYGKTFFKREGIIRVIGKRRAFNAEEIVGVYRELEEVSKELAICRAIVERIKSTEEEIRSERVEFISSSELGGSQFGD